jgi:hypothetical protein
LFGLTIGPYVLTVAYRTRSRVLALEGSIWIVATVAVYALTINSGDDSNAGTAAGLLLLSAMVAGCGRAMILRRRVARQTLDAPPAAVLEAAPATWNPSAFPAAHQSGASWSSPLVCDGQDEHYLGTTPRQAWAFAAGGAALLAVGIPLNVSDLFVAGGVLIVTPVVAASTRQRVNGPLIRRRDMGVASSVRLDTATSVAAATNPTRLPGRRAIEITGPDTARPVRVFVGFARHTAFRTHLAGWLFREGVTMTPDAAAMLREPEWATPSN